MGEASSTIWITGAAGLIGHALARQAPGAFPNHRVVPLTRTELDLTDSAAVARRFASDRPDAVIHCAALSRSPVCQAQPELARQLNVGVTRQLAELCADATLVFFSTDLVFDGRNAPYAEDAAPNPVMVYGETKAEAEQIVRANPRHLIIRTSLNFGNSPTGDRAFNEEMLNAWRAGKTLRLFTDEFRSPIAAPETARAVLDLLRADAAGIVHVGGAERLSRWQLGQALAARHPEVNPRLEPSSLRDFTGAARPADVTLDSTKAESLLGRRLPRFTDWLRAEPKRNAEGGMG
jgi:dTDP-4-dehydrorhamnose reductase